MYPNIILQDNINFQLFMLLFMCANPFTCVPDSKRIYRDIYKLFIKKETRNFLVSFLLLYIYFWRC